MSCFLSDSNQKGVSPQFELLNVFDLLNHNNKTFNLEQISIDITSVDNYNKAQKQYSVTMAAKIHLTKMTIEITVR